MNRFIRSIYTLVRDASRPRSPSGLWHHRDSHRIPAWVSEMDPEATRALETTHVTPTSARSDPVNLPTWVLDLDPDLEKDPRWALATHVTPRSTSSRTMDRPGNLPAWVLEIDPDLEMDPKWALATINQADLHPSPLGLLRYDFKALREIIKKIS